MPATAMKRIVLVGLLACIACQRYVESDVAPSIVGSDVRVSLNDEASRIAFSSIGSRVQQAEGRVVRADDSSLAIGVTGVTRLGGLQDAWGGDTVVFNRSEIVGVQKKQLSRTRTFLSVGAFVVGAILAHSQLAGGSKTVVGEPRPGGGN
jgi:hypothetical protein